ncbi:MAG: DUF1857 family protein [Holophagaceae bacterium]|nr:DUF1857 family protein [Holophagaceae bacterium]
MPRCNHSLTVRAPLETVWALLLDKIEHPQRYIESVMDYSILERGDGWVLREMELPGEFRLRERILVDEAARSLTFTLVEHPSFEGSVRNHVRALPGREDAVELEFEMDWRERPGAPSPAEDPCGMVQSAVAHMRDIAEELCRAAEGQGR